MTPVVTDGGFRVESLETLLQHFHAADSRDVAPHKLRLAANEGDLLLLNIDAPLSGVVEQEGGQISEGMTGVLLSELDGLRQRLEGRLAAEQRADLGQSGVTEIKPLAAPLPRQVEQGTQLVTLVATRLWPRPLGRIGQSPVIVDQGNDGPLRRAKKWDLQFDELALGGVPLQKDLCGDAPALLRFRPSEFGSDKRALMSLFSLFHHLVCPSSLRGVRKRTFNSHSPFFGARDEGMIAITVSVFLSEL